jgi:hypothetical protein
VLHEEPVLRRRQLHRVVCRRLIHLEARCDTQYPSRVRPGPPASVLARVRSSRAVF